MAQKTISLNEKHADFFQSVFDIVRLIPEGRVTNYGAIAAAIGSKQSSRMVGWALNASHKFSDIPAHRVVNRQGLLTGKMNFETPNEMQELLEKEGIQIKNNQVKDFKNHFWNPLEILE